MKNKQHFKKADTSLQKSGWNGETAIRDIFRITVKMSGWSVG